MRWRNRWDVSFEWHDWFAWRPVVIGGVSIWLERIERRRVTKHGGYSVWTDWEYRTLAALKGDTG